MCHIFKVSIEMFLLAINIEKNERNNALENMYTIWDIIVAINIRLKIYNIVSDNYLQKIIPSSSSFYYCWMRLLKRDAIKILNKKKIWCVHDGEQMNNCNTFDAKLINGDNWCKYIRFSYQNYVLRLFLLCFKMRNCCSKCSITIA